MRVNPRLGLASSVLWLAAAACSPSSLANDDLGRGDGGGDAGSVGAGGAIALDSATAAEAAVQDSPTEVDGSVADSGTLTSEGGESSEGGDAGLPGTDPDGGSGRGAETIVWNGEDVSPVCSGWANPTTTCATAAQTAVSHSPPTSVQFAFNDQDQAGDWLGGGWDWVNSQVGPYGTDIRSMSHFSFWLKTEGQVAELSFNLLCNGAPALDQTQHHTGKVVVSTYEPQWNDGNWHQISVPLADLTQPAGFDPQHVAEFQFFNTGAGDGSFFFDDLAFDGFD